MLRRRFSNERCGREGGTLNHLAPLFCKSVHVVISFWKWEAFLGHSVCLFILKARSHDPFLRIRFLLVPKIGSCEHIENDRKWPSDTRVRNFEKMDGNRTCSIFIRHSSWKMKGTDKILHDIPVIVLAPDWRSLSVLKIGSFSPQKRNLERNQESGP